MITEKGITALLIVAILLATTPALAWVGNLNTLSPQAQIIKTPDWLFETNRSPYIAMGDHRAMVVSSGCDVNGDGFDDLVVGRKDYDSLDYRNAGRAWLFLGGENGLSDIPYITFYPPQVRHTGLFGNHVACAGDLDGDGDEEIMISMTNYMSDDSLPGEGAVFVYYGSKDGPPATYDWMARGDSAWRFLGNTAESAGDVNGDHYDDIIVGTGENIHQAVSHAYVWLGGPDGLGAGEVASNADWIATGPTPGAVAGNHFGWFVYGIGSVNGDEYDDIMITAYRYDGAVSNQGAAFVWYGADRGLGDPGTPDNADWMATSGQSNSYFGTSGDGAGDLNGDGYDDLAIGAMLYDGLQWEGGKVFVWYGADGGLGDPGTPANADWSAEGTSGSQFGFITRPAGDINLDGYADLLITAPNYTVDTGHGLLGNAGAWFIWKGSAKEGLGDHGTIANADVASYSDQGGAGLGCCEAGTADVNGNHMDDIFVPAWKYDHPEQDEGIVFGYYSWMSIYLPLVFQQS